MSFGYGNQTPWDSTSDFAAIRFIIRQMMGQMATMRLVKVVAVNSKGEAAAAGTVDVQPLVSLLDGNGNVVKGGVGVVNGIPWYRLQGGLNAVICDPQAGDVGYVVVADRDISAVKASGGKQSNPSSQRRFSMADGIYVGGVLAAAPTCYFLFKSDGGIKIADRFGNVLESSAAGFAITGNLSATGGMVAGFGGGDQVGLQSHIHIDSQGGLTHPPNPGT